MTGGRSVQLGTLLEHDALALLILALAALTLGGVGSPVSVGGVGALLCVSGCLQRKARADLWAVLPMGMYLLLGLLSTYRVYGTLAEGYVPCQAVLLAVYLLMGCLEGEEVRLLRRLAALWASGAAAAGVVEFTLHALQGSGARLGGLLHNPNALGIFLTVGWFTLQAGLSGQEEPERLRKLLEHAEPILLTALALTLSMGSFLALAAGMLVLLVQYRRGRAWREVFAYACRILARASLGIGLGLLMYFTARHTRIPWFCLLLLAYLLALAVEWPELNRFLRAVRPAAAVMAGCGVLVAAAAIAIRPSALATFAERLEMMADGLGYIPDHPLLGLGPYQWRLYNLHGGGKYFNTWHIHNFLIHVAVELGIPAALALLAVLVRCVRKGLAPAAAAFVFHGMMDTGFFYLGVTALALITAGEPRKGARKLEGSPVRLVFAALFVLFLCCVFQGRAQA